MSLHEQIDQWIENMKGYFVFEGETYSYEILCETCKAVSVPEPGTTLLLGIGLAFIVIAYMLRNK